ncbi:rhomboid family intramembrane serine protease [Thalassorhabdus alkalitolerans]|uniref:Rhomboid family intramembrane serine protease n=1 Tax=Thalassorhabdus alkalitolerans TaxID=2282697 RepID=A0ABW0YPS4_9BACI
MEVLRQNYLFWRLVHYLVIEEKMRVIEISPDQKQVWLEKDQEGNPAVIRVFRADIDWSKWLKEDIEKAKKSFQKAKRFVAAKKAPFYNVYVSPYPPIDNWNDAAKKQADYPGMSMSTYVIASSNTAEESDRVEDLLKDLQTKSHWKDMEYVSEDVELETQHLIREVKKTAEERTQRERSLFLYGKPILTTILLICILSVYFIVEQQGGSTNITTLIDFGAKYNPAIIDGEWWRLLTAMFLHIGFLHLFMNSLALYFLGGAVERIYGTFRFFFIYLTAGLFGSAASFAFNEQISAGASGAIFGCFGALLYFGLIHKKLFFRTMGTSVIVILIINLSFGFLVPMVDNGAHIGGLIGGFIASAFLHLPKHRQHVRQLLFLAAALVAGAGLFAYGFVNEDKGSTPLVQLQMGQELLEEGEYEDARPLIESAIEEGEERPEAFFLLAYAEANLEMYEEARGNLEQAIDLRPEFHEAHYNLALVYRELGELDEARDSVERALELEPDEELYQNLAEDLEE